MKKSTVLAISFAIGLYAQLGSADTTKLINGEPVDRALYPEVLSLGGCTAAAVGPRVIITASHCVNNGGTARFSIDDQSYSARMTRSPRYTGSPYYSYDVALGMTDREIEGIDWATVGGAAEVGKTLTIFGFGCTRPGGGGGNDGVLRMGDATISGFSRTDVVSGGGAALCYGDSGGPAFEVSEEGQMLLLGINSKGNIRDTNYNARTDLEENHAFIANYAEEKGVDICGINVECNPRFPHTQR